MAEVGISDISVYLPAAFVETRTLLAGRAQGGQDTARLERAVAATGQQRSRAPEVWEDTVTMCSQAAIELLSRNWAGPALRHLVCGTETPVDHAKPLSAYCQGLLEAAGALQEKGLSSFEVKHACAAGTCAMWSVLCALRLAPPGRANEKGLVLMGDIARYAQGSTAEITQGAGAVALLLEQHPRLLALDPAGFAFCSDSVDDFFRPEGQETASVKGRYSMDCYLTAMDGALQRLKELQASEGRSPAQACFLDGFDYLLFHAPFAQMPMQAARHLLEKEGVADPEARLAAMRVAESHRLVSQSGNLYTGALYLCLQRLLINEYARLGDGIAGRRVLLFSYGSGNTMIAFTGRIVDGAGTVIANMPDPFLAPARSLDVAEYSALMALPKHDRTAMNAVLTGQTLAAVPAGAFFLREIREDGYRIYGRKGSSI